MKNSLSLIVSLFVLLSLTVPVSYAGNHGKDKEEASPKKTVRKKKEAGGKVPRKKPSRKERQEAARKRERSQTADEGTSATEEQILDTPLKMRSPRRTTGLTPLMGGLAFSPIAVATPDEEQHEANISNLSNLLTGNPEYFQEILRRQFAQHRDVLEPLLRLERENDPAAVIDEQVYFEHLITDPAHLVKKLKKGKEFAHAETRVKSILEAFAGLEAVHRDKIQGPLIRGPKEIEFYANGIPIDVKTTRFNLWLRTYSQLPDAPNGEAPAVDPTVQEHVDKLAKAIVKQLGIVHHSAFGTSHYVKVLLDTSFLSRKKAEVLDRAILEALAVCFPDSYQARAEFMEKSILSVNLSSYLQFVFHPVIDESESELKPKKLVF